MEPKRILFFKLGAIGDVLMTTPLIRQVRKNFPKAKIDYLVGGHSAKILEGNSNIDEIISFDEKIFLKKKIIGWIKIIHTIKKRKYDLIFVCDKHWIFNMTALLARAPIRVGFNRMGKEGIGLTNKVHYREVRHSLLYYLDLAKAAGLKVDYTDTQMDISISNADECWAAEFWKKNKLGSKTIGIAPGGAVNPGQTFLGKRWPAEKYAELCEKLIARGNKIIIIGGPGDEVAAQTIAAKAKVVNAIGKASIKQSAALIKKCRAFVCNDSGPMHIAAATGTRVISLFGPTDPRRLAPIGKKNKYVWHEKEPVYDEIYKTKPVYGGIDKITVSEIIKLALM
jgi:lipopolysaccharide heptosyltransferase II